MRLITLSFAALLATAGCSKKGADKPKATPEDEAFLDSLNGKGLLQDADSVENGFLSAGGGDCFILSVGMPGVEGLRDKAAALGKAPHLNDCLIAIHNAAAGMVGVIADALGGQTPTCEQGPALEEQLREPLEKAMCVMKHARNQCAADAKKLGAKTELDEVDVYCDDDPPSEPSGPTPGAPSIGAKEEAPAPGAPPPPPPVAPK